jgi:hypothetical protein
MRTLLILLCLALSGPALSSVPYQDECGADCNGQWDPGEDYPPGFPENQTHPLFCYPPWDGLPNEATLALHWDLADLGMGPSDLWWAAWWTYWDECYHSDECWRHQ